MDFNQNRNNPQNNNQNNSQNNNRNNPQNNNKNNPQNNRNDSTPTQSIQSQKAPTDQKKNDQNPTSR